jgi:hypothetical protein
VTTSRRSALGIRGDHPRGADGVEDGGLDGIGPLAGESNGSGMWPAGLRQDVEPRIVAR